MIGEMAQFVYAGDDTALPPKRSLVLPAAAARKRTWSNVERLVLRWIHILFGIPILGYIYSPFDKIPQYAFAARFIFVPVMLLSALWMWKGHLVRRLIARSLA